MATDGSNDKQSVDQIATFLGTRKLADFCRNEIIPKMNNEQFVDTLTKNVTSATSYFYMRVFQNLKLPLLMYPRES